MKTLQGQSYATINSILKNMILEEKSQEVEFVLLPNNFIVNAKINRKPEADNYNTPILDVDMKLDSFHLQLNSDQVYSFLLLLDSIDRLKTAQTFRKWRPNVSVKGKWFYYFQLVFVCFF